MVRLFRAVADFVRAGGGNIAVSSYRKLSPFLLHLNTRLTHSVIDWYLTRTRFSSPHIFNFHLVAPSIDLLVWMFRGSTVSAIIAMPQQPFIWTKARREVVS